ncbi:DUF6232 family protein [Planotetraspora sp. GP83]|uniref:DUF6232 family protein n=1 Tax=Planotetraspora sp. GP83 TaxID=3156264 RepID=UPI003515B851
MAKEQVGEIRISKRIVRIGHEVYPLANISRVQTLRVVWGGKLSTFYPLREIAFLVVVVGAIIAAAVVVVPELDINADFNVEEAARQFATVAAILAAIRVTYLLFVLLYRLLIRRTRYALVIETAGTQFAALSGTAQDEIHRIEGEIVSAIEDPPSHERVLHVSGDLVIGEKIGRDKYEQGGTGNRMTLNK